MIQQLLFIVISLAAFGYAGMQFMRIRRNILLGREEAAEAEQTAVRWRHLLLVAFGQKKMFKNWIPAVFHFFIYAAFLLTQVELIEIFIDGIFGIHRFFAPILGGFYTFIIGFIEVLSVAAFVATVIFLARRNILRVARFQKPEMKGWPSRDANLILLGEITLLVGIFSMNGADVLLQQIDPAHYPDTGTLPVSSWLGPLLFGSLSESALHVVERFGWWLHILTVFAFLNYLPFSKHLHIVLAFFNTWHARLRPRGEMENMPEIMNEVKSMMGLGEATNSDTIPEFGAKDVPGLGWKDVLGAYSCTECGRCTAACPANITGKKLSPRKIMMDVRDRAEEIGKKLKTGSQEYLKAEVRGQEGVVLTAENFDDGRSLFDYITREEIHACTTCNACVEACPVMIDPLNIILQLRRHEILMESSGPAEWLPLFNSIENGGSAWAMSIDRDAWSRD